jgi:hypothetical protein
MAPTLYWHQRRRLLSTKPFTEDLDDRRICYTHIPTLTRFLVHVTGVGIMQREGVVHSPRGTKLIAIPICTTAAKSHDT